MILLRLRHGDTRLHASHSAQKAADTHGLGSAAVDGRGQQNTKSRRRLPATWGGPLAVPRTAADAHVLVSSQSRTRGSWGDEGVRRTASYPAGGIKSGFVIRFFRTQLQWFSLENPGDDRSRPPGSHCKARYIHRRYRIEGSVLRQNCEVQGVLGFTESAQRALLDKAADARLYWLSDWIESSAFWSAERTWGSSA
jgi:hypothetical protein